MPPKNASRRGSSTRQTGTGSGTTGSGTGLGVQPDVPHASLERPRPRRRRVVAAVLVVVADEHVLARRPHAVPDAVPRRDDASARRRDLAAVHVQGQDAGVCVGRDDNVFPQRRGQGGGGRPPGVRRFRDAAAAAVLEPEASVGREHEALCARRVRVRGAVNAQDGCFGNALGGDPGGERKAPGPYRRGEPVFRRVEVKQREVFGPAVVEQKPIVPADAVASADTGQGREPGRSAREGL
mmetsp:Transcript_27861/g.66186  ORF Transcript_27861/g.66186 Transcript_27861/m.66186 type:complete len:239 (-) Transcript_27861:2608-3324(-)